MDFSFCTYVEPIPEPHSILTLFIGVFVLLSSSKVIQEKYLSTFILEGQTMRRLILVLVVFVCGVGQAEGAVITGVSIPVNSQNDLVATSRSR